MKTTIMLLCALTVSAHVIAQSSRETGNKEKMQPFSAWLGKWQGEGSMQMGPGAPSKSSVEETIQSKLDGTILLIEGIGRADVPATKQQVVVHHALAVLWYDQASNQYKFRSWLKDGRSTDAWFKPTEVANRFQWGFDTPNGGATRYTITLDPVKKTWNEIGEYSQDRNTWSKFFEMNLKKVD